MARQVRVGLQAPAVRRVPHRPPMETEMESLEFNKATLLQEEISMNIHANQKVNGQALIVIRIIERSENQMHQAIEWLSYLGAVIHKRDQDGAWIHFSPDLSFSEQAALALQAVTKLREKRIEFSGAIYPLLLTPDEQRMGLLLSRIKLGQTQATSTLVARVAQSLETDVLVHPSLLAHFPPEVLFKVATGDGFARIEAVLTEDAGLGEMPPAPMFAKAA